MRLRACGRRAAGWVGGMVRRLGTGGGGPVGRVGVVEPLESRALLSGWAQGVAQRPVGEAGPVIEEALRREVAGRKATAAAATTVTFTDRILELIIREELNRPVGPITKRQMLALTDLRIVNRPRPVWSESPVALRNLEGLQYAKNLTRLDISYNRIEDLGPLRRLRHLEYLDASNNRISNLRPLAGLASLRDLNLAGNVISDVEALRTLKGLRDLSLYGNQVSDVRALSGLGNLRDLTLTDNRVKDLRPLLKMRSLEMVDVMFNGLRLSATVRQAILKLRARGVKITFGWQRLEDMGRPEASIGAAGERVVDVMM